MRFAGTSSWSLEQGGSDLVEMALFIRDASGLTLIDTAEDVPPLMGVTADMVHVVEAEVRREAGDQWESWWAQIVAHEFRGWPGDRGDQHGIARSRFAAREAMADPPNFTVLDDRRALQSSARATFSGFRRWKAPALAPGPNAKARSPLSWQTMKQTAEDVAFDRRVDIGEVSAKVDVLRVQGTWWRRVAPGAVLCSFEAASNSATAQVLLRDAFDSYVMRSR